MNKHKFLTEKAFEWLSNPANSGEQPEFSALKGTTMIFNDNGASDEIEEFLIEQGEIQGVFIERNFRCSKINCAKAEVNMKILHKSASTANCSKCDNVIPRSTMRFVDNGVHCCFNCKPRPEIRKSFIERLAVWLAI